MLVRRVRRLVAVGRDQHGVALSLEDLARDSTHHLLVLDQQHRLLSPRGRELRDSGRLRGRLADGREIGPERGAAPRLAVDPDVAPALRHDAVDGRQPQARALARALGGEERLEDAAAGGFVHSDAGVAHRQHDVPAWYHAGMLEGVGRIDVDIARLDREPAPSRHGIAGIDHEVHHDLLDLASVDAGGVQVGGQTLGEGDVLSDESLEHARQGADDIVQVLDGGLQDLLAAEGQELAREPRRSGGGLFRLLQAGSQRIRDGNGLQRQIRLREDDGQ